MNPSKHFKASACSIKLKADEKDQILEEILGNMISAGVIQEELRDAALRALQTREQLASTGVGMGVAIPHVKLPGLQSVACSLSVHTEGVEWAAVDGDPVQVVFCVLRPEQATEEHDPEEHLEMMRWIASLARDTDFRSFARQAKKKTDLTNLLKEKAPA